MTRAHDARTVQPFSLLGWSRRRVGCHRDAQDGHAAQVQPDCIGRAYQPQQHVLAGRTATHEPWIGAIDPEGCELGVLAGPAEWASEDAIKLIEAAKAR